MERWQLRRLGQRGGGDELLDCDGEIWYWSADNVPIYGMGTATFDAVATPHVQNSSRTRSMATMNSNVTNSVGNVSSAVEMQPMLKITYYRFTETYVENYFGLILQKVWTRSYDGKWQPNSDAQWVQTYQATETITNTGIFGSATNSQSWSNPAPFGIEAFVASELDSSASGGRLVILPSM